MQISIKAPLLHKLYNINKNLLRLNYPYNHYMGHPLDSEDGIKSEESVSFDLSEYSITDLKKLYDLLIANDAPTKTSETITRWLEILKNPMNGEVSSLQSFRKVFDALLKGLKDKWLFYEKEDGEMCPILIATTKYYNRSKDDVEHYYITAYFGYLFPKEADSTKCFSTHEKSFSFYKSILSDDDDDDAQALFIGSDAEFESDADLDDDDDNDGEKKKKEAPKKAKKQGVKLSVVLEKKKLFLPTPELYEKYKSQITKLNKLYSKSGTQFTVNGNAFALNHTSYSFYHTLISMQEDGDDNKIVINNTGELRDIKRTSDTDYGSMSLPYHPYIKAYDISMHREVFVHVDKLVDYQYNEKVVDSLILPDSHKKLLNSLIGGENNFDDIVSGKSGGIIILGSGIAGTGKTLTAEVYSEVVKKPLYQIQSAQLGTKPEDIEKNLKAILRRADRWNAVLLIDECDAYVFQRGEDMIQNCVVGVFLRLLEYYKGILFLTTNRHDIIDGAIKSRLTAHIKYGIPSKEHQIKILDNLSKRFNISISQDEQVKIIELHPKMVGRDIRNLLKLTKKFFHKEKGNVKLTADMVNQVGEFVPFIEK